MVMPKTTINQLREIDSLNKTAQAKLMEDVAEHLRSEGDAALAELELLSGDNAAELHNRFSSLLATAIIAINGGASELRERAGLL